jgi:hypothetical protein
MEIDIQQKLKALEQQILDAYAKHTIIEQVCTTRPVDPTVKAGQFRQIANNILIKRERITTPNNFLLLGEIGASVAREEIRYLVRSLTEKSPKTEPESFTIATISNSARTMADQGFTPNHIFMPIDYSHNVLEWNQSTKRRDWTKGGIFDTFYTEDGIFLKVTYSNKYMPFNDAILTSLESNIWEYRPTETPTRLTAKFDWNYSDPEDTILRVKTVFYHMIVDVRGNLVIGLEPQN